MFPKKLSSILDKIALFLQKQLNQAKMLILLSIYESTGSLLQKFISFCFACKHNVAAFVLELQEDFSQLIVELGSKQHLLMKHFAVLNVDFWNAFHGKTDCNKIFHTHNYPVDQFF